MMFHVESGLIIFDIPTFTSGDRRAGRRRRFPPGGR